MTGLAVILAVVNRPRLSRIRFASLALLGALTLSPACKSEDPSKTDPAKQEPSEGEPGATPETPKSATPPAAGAGTSTGDSPAVTETGEVVATVQLPTGAKMTDIAAAIDAIQPGTSTILSMGLPAGLKDATGFDVAATAKLDAPMSFVVVDPTSHPKPLALLVEAKDADALSEAAKGAGHAVERRGDLVLIGPQDVVDAAKDFAFTNLVKYPDHSEIIIYPQKLVRTLAGTISTGLDAMTAALAGEGGEGMTQMFRSYAEAMVAIGEQTERVVIRVSSSPSGAELIARAYPVADSTLAQFVAAQQPSDHALLAKLPSDSPTMIMSGNLLAGPARDAFVKFTSEIMGPVYGGLSAADWEALMKPWLDNLDGRFAAAIAMEIAPGSAPNMRMHVLMGVNDSATLSTGWRAMLSKMAEGPGLEMMGMTITAKHEQKVLEHDGVEVDLYGSSIDTSKLPPEQAAAMAAAGSGSQSMHLAAFDEYAAMTTFDAEGEAIRAVIDAARGKGDNLAISAPMTLALDAAKQRGDSMVVFMDVGSVASQAGPQQVPFSAISMSTGSTDGVLELRMSVIK